jgi:hypothetical protein
VLFQFAASASGFLVPSGELAGISASDRLSWFAELITSWRVYANPIGIFFLYLAMMKWVLIDRRTKIAWVLSAAYYVIFGLYYGALFVAGVNGELHAEFDRSLGINPGPLASAIFPLALALVLPLVVMMLISIAFWWCQKAGQAAAR